MSDAAGGSFREGLVTPALVDLLLSAALQWQERWGDEEGFRYYVHRAGQGTTVRTLDPDDADRMGRLLLEAVGDAAADGYTFSPLPGPAAPEIVLACVHSYSYTALAHGRFKGRDTGAFVRALDSAAAVRLAARGPDVPWGLEAEDRDIFVRFARDHRGWERRR